ncbi:putative ribonuclease H-like domain-containing protein [Tanacetum coccineum]
MCNIAKTKIVEGVMIEMPITTAEEKVQRRLEVKDRNMEILATRKTQRNLLKQQYEKFIAPSLEMLDQTFDRIQKLVSQLKLLDEKLSQEDVNQKLLKSLSPEWNTHVVVWRNKADLDTMSMDDLYNNLKMYEPEVKGMSSSSSSTQNMAFVSSSNNNTCSTNVAVNTAHGVSTASAQFNAANSINIDNLSDAVICAFFSSQLNSPQLVHEDLQQIYPNDMEEIDLIMANAMDTIRERNSKKSRQQEQRKLKKECACETSTSTALVSCDGLSRYDWSDQVEEGPNYELMAFSSSRNPKGEKITRKGPLKFKTMINLVRKFVRGLPSNFFENDQTCVACQKGKQHRASCKSKTENSISLPLHLLHMDLFGPTFVKSLKKKMYCLVVTYDYSRFTWVFFLATKDETSGILKSFITGIENLVDHKVKVIRCDNRTEFKNREMNQFCEMKGILRQFSVARTPQQNGVAERRNRTLIEAARTMLADSKLPTTFWAEAVNTA